MQNKIDNRNSNKGNLNNFEYTTEIKDSTLLPRPNETNTKLNAYLYSDVTKLQETANFIRKNMIRRKNPIND